MNETVENIVQEAENYAAEQNDLFGVSYKKTYNQKLCELIAEHCIDLCKETQAIYIQNLKQTDNFYIKNMYNGGEQACKTIINKIKDSLLH